MVDDYYSSIFALHPRHSHHNHFYSGPMIPDCPFFHDDLNDERSAESPQCQANTASAQTWPPFLPSTATLVAATAIPIAHRQCLPLLNIHSVSLHVTGQPPNKLPVYTTLYDGISRTSWHGHSRTGIKTSVRFIDLYDDIRSSSIIGVGTEYFHQPSPYRRLTVIVADSSDPNQSASLEVVEEPSLATRSEMSHFEMDSVTARPV
jgi:hypothetical protein